MKTYLHGLIDYAGTLELIFRVGDVGLPERNRYTSSREEEEDAQNQSCDKYNGQWENAKCTRRNGVCWRR